jgi:hypothetical protein
MNPLREAFLLPCLFLTVGLLAGLRIGPQVRLEPPPLVTLVLAMLLIGALVRSGTVRPDRLMNQHRTPLENLSGLVVLLTLFAASAQIFNLVTPSDGLLHILVSVFFFVQLLTTLTAVRDRLSMLRSLAVLLGCAFVLRFIALESLYAPGRGLMKRVMTAIMEGITLGALDYSPVGTLTGYVAFLALALYLLGLVLIGSQTQTSDRSNLPAIREQSGSLVASVLIVFALAGCSNGSAERVVRANDNTHAVVSAEARERALASAMVWRLPEVPIPEATLGDSPSRNRTPGSDPVSCRFVPQEVGGTTPKFYCELPDGEVVKVKYGRNNPELAAEVAATRLLSALGFGADTMVRVSAVQCYGCPAFPFQALRCHSRTELTNLCLVGSGNYERAVFFEPAVIERRVEGTRIESFKNQGWAWYELDRIDPASGGSPRAHVDGLRLMAAVLAHWDNKSENQRLICTRSPEACASSPAPSLALMQDLGATFGPTKLDLMNWRRVKVWQDPRACRVSMKQLPYQGATFPDVHISEEGRRFLLTLLEQLSPSQVRELFTGSGITAFDGVAGEARDPEAWNAVFFDKVRQVRDAGPCPNEASLQRSRTAWQ